MVFLVLKLLILKRIKNDILGQSKALDNNLCENVMNRSKRQSLNRLKLKQYKTLLYEPLGGL